VRADRGGSRPFPVEQCCLGSLIMSDRSEGTGASTDAMRARWRGFARDDPMFHIASNRRTWDPEDFLEAGRPTVARAVEWAGSELPHRTALEIGCGLGRMLVHLARRFERVYGVDIAPEMIEGARELMPANVELVVNSGDDLAPLDDEQFDFVLSIQVFQHIPDGSVIARYLGEIARVLRRSGRAVLQFDTRSANPVRRLVLTLPDPVLPPTRRRYLRRYPLDPGDLDAMLRGAGLRAVDERGRGTANHELLLERG
jgi:SAM-dependent methyltransferase